MSVVRGAGAGNREYCEAHDGLEDRAPGDVAEGERVGAPPREWGGFVLMGFSTDTALPCSMRLWVGFACPG
jgi:hypothetical protein